MAWTISSWIVILKKQENNYARFHLPWLPERLESAWSTRAAAQHPGLLGMIGFQQEEAWILQSSSYQSIFRDPWVLKTLSWESVKSKLLHKNSKIWFVFFHLLKSRQWSFPEATCDIATEWMQKQIWESNCLLLWQTLQRLAASLFPLNYFCFGK